MPRVRAQHRFQGALEEKQCSGCDQWKVLTEFGKDKSKWDGLENRCKVCHNTANEKRRRMDVGFAIVGRLRCRLWYALKAQGVRKTTSTMKLCGCSLDYLKKYLEKQFVDGMTWENRDKWHIDHIRPCCSFDLTDPEQQKQCFHYSNLQPLWARDNMIKGAKW